MHKEKKVILELSFVGEDDRSRPVYKDQFGRLWKDVGLGDYEKPFLHAAVNNVFDGEPDQPIGKEFVIIKPQERCDMEFQYMMLDRLRSDCDYYLGFGGRNAKVLAEKNERQQIEAMKKLWLSFPEEGKPEWLTWEQILAYEKQMCKDCGMQ